MSAHSPDQAPAAAPDSAQSRDAGPQPAALIVAGGHGRRMGGEKLTVLWHGVPLWQHAATRLRPHFNPVLLGLRGDQTPPDDVGRFGVEVVPDAAAGAGPLASLAGGLRWLEAHGSRDGVPIAAAGWLVTLPVDVPCLPASWLRALVSRAIVAGRQSALIHADHDGEAGARLPREGMQPLCAAWHVSLARRIGDKLDRQERALWRLHGDLGSLAVSLATLRRCSDEQGPTDPLLNVNTPDDLPPPKAQGHPA